MIEALQRRRRFVAMIRDGVNDAQALTQADVGIAMGLGSDMVKGISDMVLIDDKLASILHGVKEGRRMFDNIEKYVRHLLSENIAQACVLLIGLVFKDDLRLSVFPLAPVEILWVVMATSALPDMGLGFEGAARNVMRRPPRPSRQGIFTIEAVSDILIYGLWMATLCLSAFSVVVFGFGNGNLASGCNRHYSIECDLVFRARATTFVCLVWFALILSWEMVDQNHSLFYSWHKDAWTKPVRSVWKNQFLFWGVIAGFLTVFPTLYIPVVNHVIFKHEGITWEWIIVIIESIIFLVGVEAWKWGKRVFIRSRRRNATGLFELETSVFGAVRE